MNQANPTSNSNLNFDYDYDFNPGRMERLLYFSAGVDLQLLKHCPNYDRVKLQGIGGTVLATALLAFLSGSYAFYTVFFAQIGDSGGSQAMAPLQMAISVIFGLVWAAVIYNLDRFIVSTTGHGDGTESIEWFEIVRALPRFLMACLIGLVISKPLEIRIMKTEIETVLMEARKAEYDKYEGKDRETRDREIKEANEVKADLVKQRLAKRSEIDKAQEVRDQVEKEVIAESQTGISVKFNAKKKLLEQRMAELEETKERVLPELKQFDERIKAQEDAIKSANEKYLTGKDEWQRKADGVDGLINRIEIAHKKSPTASWFLTLMLIFIEVAPLFFKMMLTLSPIDYLTENQKRLAKVRRGIWWKHDVSAGGYLESASSTGSKDDDHHLNDLKQTRFYESELEEAKVIGKLKIDRELTELVQQSYKDEVANHIQSHPSEYVERLKPSA